MKLWITSQDELNLFQASNIRYLPQGTRHILTIKFEGGWTETIGEYPSKKRCLEVLSEIKSKITRAKSNNVIYEMPKK